MAEASINKSDLTAINVAGDGSVRWPKCEGVARSAEGTELIGEHVGHRRRSLRCPPCEVGGQRGTAARPVFQKQATSTLYVNQQKL